MHGRVHGHPRLLPLPRLAAHPTAMLSCAELRVRLHVLRVVLHLAGGWARLHLLGLVGDHTTHTVLMVRHKLGAIRRVKLRLARRAMLLELLLLKLLLLLLLLLLLERWVPVL